MGGIDFMLYAFKFKISLDNILIGFINQILQLLSNDIIPVYIIDGYADDTKREVINKRNSRRDKITNGIDDIKLQLNNFTDNIIDSFLSFLLFPFFISSLLVS